MKRLVIALALACTLMVPQAALADPPVDCGGRAGCEIEVTDPGSGGGGGTGGSAPGGSEQSGGPQVCKKGGKKVPCKDQGDGWSNSMQCYVGIAKGIPKGDPRWEGNTTGAVYYCRTGQTGLTRYFWSETTPGGPAAPPDPRELAQTAIKRMGLRPVTVGIVPKAQDGKVGIVGMPVWLWSTSRQRTVVGPVTETATAGPYSVTATARLERTIWTMGDGETVLCNGPNAVGTPYKAAYKGKDSPTCGYRYSQDGDYTVQARSYWMVEWAGLGQTGQIPVELNAGSADITIGEVQVLVQ